MNSHRPSGPPAQTETDRFRVKEAAALGKISPAYVYIGIDEGWFKSWTVKRRGFERGIRYIDAKSFRDWLNSQREEVTEETSKAQEALK